MYMGITASLGMCRFQKRRVDCRSVVREVELLHQNSGLLVGSFSGSDSTTGGVGENCDKNGALCWHYQRLLTEVEFVAH